MKAHAPANVRQAGTTDSVFLELFKPIMAKVMETYRPGAVRGSCAALTIICPFFCSPLAVYTERQPIADDPAKLLINHPRITTLCTLLSGQQLLSTISRP